MRKKWKMERHGPPIVSLLFLFAFFFLAASHPVTTQEVEEALTCQCGCGLTIHSCNHLECGFGVPAKEEIARLIQQGMSKQDILTHFASRYGEKILSAPTTVGFNLVAWITPFAAVALGGSLIALVFVRWARKNEPPPSPAPQDSRDKYRDILAKELQEFDRE